jgi:hypothetical protein
MAVRLGRRGERGAHPGDEVPTGAGEPDTIVIMAVVGGIVALVIALWIWLG